MPGVDQSALTLQRLQFLEEKNVNVIKKKFTLKTKLVQCFWLALLSGVGGSGGVLTFDCLFATAKFQWWCIIRVWAKWQYYYATAIYYYTTAIYYYTTTIVL